MEARTHFLHDVVARALAAAGAKLADPAVPVGSSAASPTIAVAYSGGLDSTVLLHLMRQYANDHQIALRAFHVHHGLSANAELWLAHCRQTCLALKVAFDVRRIKLESRDGGSIEEAARNARYAALGEMCIEHGVNLLLTAHHVDDQAETVLLQMLRGSGLAGMSGMDDANRAPGLLGSDAIVIARPLLGVLRGELEEFASRHGIANIEDESNVDPRFARNALRHRVMPALEANFPGFQQRFARTAQHAGTAQALLIELAEVDIAQCRIEGLPAALEIAPMVQLSPGRADNMLRHWFSILGLRMPSTAWLHEMRTQLLIAKADARLCVTHPDCHIRRHRNRVFITPRDDSWPAEIPPRAFVWNGEASLHFPSYRGTLYFEAAPAGIDAAWLRGRDCRLHLRAGGERLKLAADRPTRSLKQHYQARDIPSWERETLPIVSSASSLLFAAGLGMDCSHFAAAGGTGVALSWKFDDATWRVAT